MKSRRATSTRKLFYAGPAGKRKKSARPKLDECIWKASHARVDELKRRIVGGNAASTARQFFGDCGRGLYWSQHLVKHVIHIVDEAVGQAAFAPSFQLDLATMWSVLLENLIEPARRCGVKEAQRDLVVRLE